jgi:hypothetical protein
MKKILALALVIVCALALSACKEEDVLHLGLNAEIVAIDAETQTLYVADYGEEEVFGEECAIDCRVPEEKQNIIYVDYTTHELSDISFADLVVGDKITVNAYESQLSQIDDGLIAVEQIQLATQRLTAQ